MLNPITDLSAIAEQLCRLEHKFDLVIKYLAEKDGDFQLEKISDKKHIDPITHEEVQYYMDLFKRHVVRVSKDGTGLYPPSPILFTPTTSSTGNTGHGGENSSNE